MIIILGLVAGFLTVGLILVLYREHRLKKSLRQISKKMQEIIAQDTDEKVMLFTHEADVIEPIETDQPDIRRSADQKSRICRFPDAGKAHAE